NSIDPVYLGDSIEELKNAKAILLIGSVLREEQPLIAHRIRQAVLHSNTQLNVISIMSEDLLCKVDNQVTCDCREVAYFLAQVVKASGDCGAIDLSEVAVSDRAMAIAKSMMENNGYIILGEVAKSLPNYSEILCLVQQLSKNIQGKFGVLSGRANEAGAKIVGCVPYKGAFNQTIAAKGMNVDQMLTNSLKSYILFNTELEQDAYNSQKALSALGAAQTVMVISAFVNDKMKEYADVILPITPYTETAGSYINMFGKWQTFNGVTKPLGSAKPGWKVLRVLANQLGINEFQYNSIEDIRAEIKPEINDIKLFANSPNASEIPFKVVKPDLNGLIRFGIQGPYAVDSITRRAGSLQETYYAKLPILSISPQLADKLGVVKDQVVIVAQGEVKGEFNVAICKNVPENVVIFAVNEQTNGFAGRYDAIEVRICS
ncbi:MAG: molybdopterin-dependent oxidoreductase, partial [Burkholderiales bacterium]|nr:molybdopterin-dependent oxidoreductase [Burkholderiales bacterium]